MQANIVLVLILLSGVKHILASLKTSPTNTDSLSKSLFDSSVMSRVFNKHSASLFSSVF